MYFELLSFPCRGLWHISRHAELPHPLCHVHILWHGSHGTTVPEISLVEEVYDNYADCE